MKLRHYNPYRFCLHSFEVIGSEVISRMRVVCLHSSIVLSKFTRLRRAVVPRPSVAIVPRPSAAIVHHPSGAVVPHYSGAVFPHYSGAVVHRSPVIRRQLFCCFPWIAYGRPDTAGDSIGQASGRSTRHPECRIPWGWERC